MTLLGEFSLWMAFLLGIWATIIAFSGRWQDRPELAASVTNASYGICCALLVASISLWKGLASHDFNIEYVAAYTSRNLPDGYIFSAFWAGQKGSLLFWAVVLSLFAAVAQLITPRRYAPAHALRGRGHLGGDRLLRLYHALRRQPVRAAAVHAGGRTRPQPPAPESGDDDPSPDALPRLHQHHHSVRLRHRRAAHPRARHGVDPRDPEVDAGELAVPLDRHHAGDVVGVCRAGLGWILGVGSGREREPAPLAHDDGVPPLRDDPGKAGDAQAVERGPDHRHVPAEHLRDVHHPFRRDRQRPQLHPEQRGLLLPRLPGGGGDPVVTPCCIPAGRCSRPTCSWSRC